MTTPSTTFQATLERTRNRQSSAYFVAFITLGLAMSSLGPTLPGLAENTRATIGQISVLFTAESLGMLAGNLVSGRYYDRRPAHPFLAGAVVIISALLALIPLISSLAVLAAVVFVIGVCAGSIDVAGNTLLMWVFGRQVGPRMNALHFFFGLGALLAPIFVAQAIALNGGIAWAYWLLAVLALAPVALFLRVPSPAIPQAHAAGDASIAPTRWLLVGLLATMFFLFVGAELSYGGWIYTYAISLDLATATSAGYLTSLFWASLTLGRLISIPIAGRVRPRYLLIADLAGLAVSLVLLLLFSGSSAILWIATFGFGLSTANVYPTLMVLAERHLRISAKITSIFLIGGSLGSMTVPLLIGQRFETSGPQVMMAILLAVVILTAAVLAAFLLAIRPKAEVTQPEFP